MLGLMKVTELYKQNKHTFSFEFFPPKTPKGGEKLFETIKQLKKLNPAYVTCTYGAMGSTRTNTIEIVERIKKEMSLECASHLTCIAHSKSEVEEILHQLKAMGVENIVALRGDQPQDSTNIENIQDGFKHANELVSFIQGHSEFKDSFCLIVAGYPEGHMECESLDQDLENLKRKIDAGGNIITTQLFFDNTDFYRFVDKARALGITQPIVPGMIAVGNGKQIQKFSEMCGSKIPKTMQEKITLYGEDNASIEAYGIEYATEQCRDLLDQGVCGIHFYTLNKAHPLQEIYQNLNLNQS